MPMRDDQIVNLLEPGVLHCCHNATSIANRARAAIAGVDEQRLARRGYKQRRVTAFNVHEVDLQALRRCLSRRGDNDERESEGQGK